jgi:antitoxin HicB
MRYAYPARLCHYADNEIVVSFRDISWCHTSGENVAEALLEAEDALEEAIAGLIADGEPIPTPSEPLPDEYLVAVPVGMAAKAALASAMRAGGLTHIALAQRLGVNDKVVQRMLDPRHGTSVGPINEALRLLGSELVLEVRQAIAES